MMKIILRVLLSRRWIGTLRANRPQRGSPTLRSDIIFCMSAILETEDLSRAYGQFRALAPTSLVLEPGDLVALSGHNGAGKSTLLLCLSGLLRPTSGAVRVEGFDLYRDEIQAKSRLAFVPDVPRFYTELTAWEHLQFIAAAHRASDGFAPTSPAV